MNRSFIAVATILALSIQTGGCAAIVSRAASGFGNNLSGAILNQDDPEIVRDGMPSYMLLMDSFLQGDDPSPAMLSAAAELYASYGAVFADDETRATRLTRRARDYASMAICGEYAAACGWDDMVYDDFAGTLGGLSEKQADTLYVYGFSLLAYIRAHSSDWNALAELPQAEAVVERYLELAGSGANVSAYMYLGILQTIRPPAMGGKPDEARSNFEKAIALSHGRNLGAKIEFAKGYAKLMYDRELHDQLVREVLAASPYADRLTLMNVLAQEEALQLEAEADDYF